MVYRIVGGIILILMAVAYIRSDAVRSYKMAAQLAVSKALAEADEKNQKIAAKSFAEVHAAQVQLSVLEEKLKQAELEIQAAQKGSSCKVSKDVIRAINKAR